LILGESCAGQLWASRLLMLRGPARALRWAAIGNIDPAAAYALVRRMVECGGAAIAREVWHLCAQTLESPQALRIALDASTPSASYSRDAADTPEGREEWRSLLLTVLREVSEGADPYAWADRVDTQELLNVVLSAQCSTGSLDASAALADLADAACTASTADAPHWPTPVGFREAQEVPRVRRCIPDRRDMATASAKAQQWQRARANRRERTLPCGIVTKPIPGAEPVIIDRPILCRRHSHSVPHCGGHSGGAKGKKPHFLVSSPRRSSPDLWLLDPHLLDEVHDGSNMKIYGIHH